MEERVKDALQKFDEGYDCSHALLSAYADLFDFDEDELNTIRRPCGPMTGSPDAVCGAVAGALKALNHKLRAEQAAGNDPPKKSEMLREFRTRFERIHGTVNCAELIGVDISTIEGQAEALDKDVFRTKCHAYVADSARILEELIELKLNEK